MKSKIDFYSKITIALVAALLTSQLLVREVFLGYSPRIRPDIADVLVEKSLALINIDNYLAFFRGKPSSLPETEQPAKTAQQAKQELAQIPFKETLIKGVYAKETEDAVLTEVKFEEVDWIDVSYQRASGEVTTIRIPKGQTPPPPGLF